MFRISACGFRVSPSFVLLLMLQLPRAGLADDVLLLVEDVAADGLVTGQVDLTAAARWCQRTPVAPGGIRALGADGQAVPFQFVPAADFDGTSRVVGTVVLRMPKAQPTRLRLEFKPDPEQPQSPAWDGVITTPDYTVTHAAKRTGGLPWKVTFPASGKEFQTVRWNNRVHHQKLGSFGVCDDPQASVQLVARGPLCSVVRVRGHFVQGGKRPASEPSAVYDWCYFHDRPLAFVTATFRQREPFTWHELHFLEMNYPREDFPRWAGGEPLEQGEFQDTKKTHTCSRWGVVHDGRQGIGMFHCGQALFYDAGAATYLQAHGDAAWQEWGDTLRQFSAWLWLGTHEDPARAVQAAEKTLPATARVTVSVDAVRARIETVAKQVATVPPAERQQGLWRVEGAEQLEAQGRLEEAVQVAGGQQPAGWTVVSAGDLTMILDRQDSGIRLLQLFDSQTRQRLVTGRPAPLFSITLRHAESREELRLLVDAGWTKTEIVAAHDSQGPGSGQTADKTERTAGLELHWEQPLDKRLGNLRVVARVVPDQAASAVRWQLTAEGQAAPWSLWKVVFPEAAVPDLGPRGCVFFPKAAGEVQQGVWNRPFRFTGTYPSGWTTMQFMVAYREDRQSGLYLAVHDPWGSTKDLLCESRPQDKTVVLRYEHPVPDMGLPGNRFELSGQAVWQLVRGDWFDAAVTYRDWVRREAKWYPRLTAEGRPDTPLWMRELSIWALGGGTPPSCVGAMKDFAKSLESPIGFHWYSWHQIPFDNDYPHYFPTQSGFAEGVRELQSSGVFVMPYINGRLWDTRDKGLEDFEFTKIARPAVSKNEQGEPYTETYGSKESDGSPVKLGVMCPTTQVWQTKQRETVLRLMNECGVQGVYIDQIAAAAPTLCFDKTHGHPLGGGHWWTEGYWKLLDGIRQAMPPDRMLTTECNGEPYIRCVDGYLTWHWQYDGQVPAFPAVYGGSIQMFGRSYGGGETKNLALRMRAGQQLVFGEQLGWINPGLALEQDNAEFFKSVVQLRHQLRRYFYVGEMARPPQLTGNIPTVRADWQWGGTAWVTTTAVLSGAWRLPTEKRLVLIFANVSDQPVTAQVNYDANPYGLVGSDLKLVEITPSGPGKTTPTPAILQRDLTLPPRTAVAWELGVR
ncbi:MAG: DUF6259 domain-containing protein [Planctomycetota bacterium]|nr:DUF6259 domain-containing protein [Planctomycetota bacterium]